jgi:hypothetical protein
MKLMLHLKLVVKGELNKQEAGKFRSIRDRVQSIKFRVEDFKKGTWLPMLTKGLNFQTSELIPSYNVEYLA